MERDLVRGLSIVSVDKRGTVTDNERTRQLKEGFLWDVSFFAAQT